MKIRAQIGMVLNLDKCIGCHTCSVTCKNVWTNREGMEYAWFNNVETKPGIGYPKDWENQDTLERRLDAQEERQDRAEDRRQMARSWRTSSPIPTCRRSTTITSPSPSTTSICRRRPELEAFADGAPAFADHRRAHGEDRMGAELGGNPRRRVRQALRRTYNFEGVQKEIYGAVRKHLHDVSAAAVRALPQPDLRGGLPLGRDLQARGGRHRPDRPGQVPRLAHVRLGLPLQEDLLQLVDRANPRSASSAIRASRPASRPSARKPASAASAISASMLYDADRIEEAASDRRRAGSLRGAAQGLPRSQRSRGDRAGPRRRHSGAWLEAARQSPIWKMAMEWKVAFPLHPEYRTLPMVWYVPPLSPITAAAEAGKIGHRRRHAGCAVAAHPAEISRQSADRGRGGAGCGRARADAGDARLYARQDGGRRASTRPSPGGSGSPAQQIEEMYHIMAIANYEDRFVIPTSHREVDEDAYELRGSVRLLLRRWLPAQRRQGQPVRRHQAEERQAQDGSALR